MGGKFEGAVNGQGFRVALVASRWNDFVVERLVAGAKDALLRCGVSEEKIDLATAPGAFEIPLVARKLAQSGRYDAVVALGCVIRGKTPHFDYIAGEAAAGIANAAAETGVPIGFGILTCDTTEQAIERAGGKAGNKGAEAALAAVETARLLRAIEAK
jgi:6,7-dimethyl-8-ribityllumazine synthase